MRKRKLNIKLLAWLLLAVGIVSGSVYFLHAYQINRNAEPRDVGQNGFGLPRLLEPQRLQPRKAVGSFDQRWQFDGFGHG